jgi:hypothetical protein
MSTRVLMQTEDDRALTELRRRLHDPTHVFYASPAQLAQALGESEGAMQQALLRLMACGYVLPIPTGHQPRQSAYHLTVEGEQRGNRA